MVDARKYFGVTFVTLEDLADGPQRAVIDRVEEGKYGKLNLYFTDNTAIGLNATNSRALAKAFGPETNDWPRHAVELSAGEVEYQDKMQPSILITPIKPPPGEKTAAEPKPVPRGDSRDMDDDIPF